MGMSKWCICNPGQSNYSWIIGNGYVKLCICSPRLLRGLYDYNIRILIPKGENPWNKVHSAGVSKTINKFDYPIHIYGYRVLPCIEGNKYTKVEVEYITDMLPRVWIKWPGSGFSNRQFDVRYGCNLHFPSLGVVSEYMTKETLGSSQWYYETPLKGTKDLCIC